MYKRRDIRESAVQILYFADIEGGGDLSEIQSAFWEMVQENSLRKLNVAKAKAILHIAQGRNSRITKLTERAPIALSQLKAAGNLTAISSSLRSLLREESKLSAGIELLKAAMQSKSSEESILPRLADIFIANKVVQDARKEWAHALDDYPAWRNKLEGISATVSQLENISDRFKGVETIDSANTPEHGFEHIHASSKEIQTFRAETESLVKGILSKKESIDEKLALVVENYTPERVDSVDSAILRIGAYEIFYCDDIPRAVSINEAIEIAKRFGTEGSSRFVNGILDALK